MNPSYRILTVTLALVVGVNLLASTLLVSPILADEKTKVAQDVTTKVDYARDIAPVLAKYCNSCHNPDDLEGELSMESFAQFKAGGENGPAFVAGDASKSRMFLMLTGQGDSVMPPDGMEAPTANEIAMIKSWIDRGAVGPATSVATVVTLDVPNIKPLVQKTSAAVSIDWSKQGDLLAIARFKRVELVNAKNLETISVIVGFPGKVNSVQFSKDGAALVVASGISGLQGEATIWNLKQNKKVASFTGHRDSMYDAVLSPDAKTIATASYDQKIIIWDVASGEQRHVIDGHKGAVYDLEFHPTEQVLVSSSSDETLKLWNVKTGERLDTLGQPLGEQYAATFSRGGNFVIGGGIDHRIRVWRTVTIKEPGTNPLVYSRFAHEGGITHLKVSNDGSRLISVSDDMSVKIWATDHVVQLKTLEEQPSLISSIAIAPDSESFVVGRMDGSLDRYSLKNLTSADEVPIGSKVDIVKATDAPTVQVAEEEPNNSVKNAMAVTVPATISGVIHSSDRSVSGDADVFRFVARKGEQWLIETKASRDKSKLDSFVEVLDEKGDSIQRVLLRAVRDSYLTFRGKDSTTSGDFRVHNWEEMELNEYLYCNGEVVKLWLYPRGPDSGFTVYPGTGSRHTYFGTTALSHALHEPCYIVEPLSPDASYVSNGAPVFPIYFENDDDPMRRWGSDSRLMFTAPRDGTYHVRLTDVREFEGENFKYELTIRQPKPNFKVTLNGANPTINPGSGREFTVKAERLDGFEGEIRVDIDNVPTGFHVTSPLIIEAGQFTAVGTIIADLDAKQPSDEESKKTSVRATTFIDGVESSQPLTNLGQIKLADKPAKVRVQVVHDDHQPVTTNEEFEQLFQEYSQNPLQLVIHPGETISATVVVQRNGHDALVSFGKEDSGRNLPHGLIVSNIGLNGLLIPKGQSERQFFLTASKWVPEMTRLFHLRANVDGNQTSVPILLRIEH